VNVCIASNMNNGKDLRRNLAQRHSVDLPHPLSK
jgi:hypothetical protein